MNHKQTPIHKIASEMGINAHEIAQRKAYLGLSEEDITQLNKTHQSLSESQSDFIQSFSEHLLTLEEMRAIIPEAINHTDYFESITAGEYDWDYVLERLQVGLTHQQKGLDAKLYVGSFLKYLSQIIKYLCTQYSGDNDSLFKSINSIIKIISFDMGLSIDSCTHANFQTIKTLEQHLDNLFQGIDGFVWEYDVTADQYIYVSHQVETILGYTQDEWIKQVAHKKQMTHPEDIEQKMLAFSQAIAGENLEIEYRITLASGHTLWVNERITVVKNQDGKVIHLRGLVLDIEKRKTYETQLSYLADYDQLTELPNRHSFEKHLFKSIVHAKRNNEHLAILFFDLDGFKDINDSLGHAIGDQLLQTIAQRINDILRENEFAARFGGDEFCIVLENISEDYSAAYVAERCLQALEKPIQLEGYNIYPRVSIGISVFPQDGETSEKILQSADSAMYAAKAAGKHQYVFYNAEMTRRAAERLALENDLRLAIRRDEFELYYQPQVDIRSGKLVGVEALIRWHHPTQGMISPDKFIPVAEKIGLIIPLGEWVLYQACQQIAEWRLLSVEIDYVAINISGSHFCNDTLPKKVAHALKKAGLNRCDIELEITEGVMQTTENSLRNFKKIKEVGVNIAIDDFGTGFSSLSSLTELPIDVLKIDRAFIKDMINDDKQSTIVATIMAMSHALGFSVVAEGVETIEQVTYLQGIGCNIIQGYFFSKPVTAEKIPELATTNYFNSADKLQS